MSSRDTILARVRAALIDVPQTERPEDRVVPTSYRHRDEAPRTEILDRFAKRVADYKVTVERVADRAALPAAIAAACARQGAGAGARRLAVPADLPLDWLPAEVEAVPDRDDRPLSVRDLDAIDGTLTGCALGIAETGTIVLDSGAHQGRRVLTLLPDFHICIVFAEQIVGLVPEAIERLAPAVRDARRPITFVSGPSATSDIELNRVEGVHGPRTLNVLIVE